MSENSNDNANGGQGPDTARPQSRLEYMLRKKGADEAFIAQRLIDMTEATRKEWNTTTKSFQIFEDHKVRLAALEQIARLLGLYPTQKELENRHKPHETIIHVVTDHQPPKRSK